MIGQDAQPDLEESRRFGGCFAWTLVLAFLVALLTGCAFEPEGAVPLTPPPEYRAIWDSAQACTGLHGDFDRLRFFTVEGEVFKGADGPATGTTVGRTIYLASHYADPSDSAGAMVIKHEMIHALGVHGHPDHPFVSPCRATWGSYADAT